MIFKTLRAGVLRAAILVIGATLAGTGSASDVERGADVYEKRCGACHALDSNRVGPRHRDVFGRRAGTQPGYDYSSALADSDVVWDGDSLDRWLTNPQGLIPGQKMWFRLSNAVERAEIIAFLRHGDGGGSP